MHTHDQPARRDGAKWRHDDHGVLAVAQVLEPRAGQRLEARRHGLGIDGRCGVGLERRDLRVDSRALARISR